MRMRAGVSEPEPAYEVGVGDNYISSWPRLLCSIQPPCNCISPAASPTSGPSSSTRSSAIRAFNMDSSWKSAHRAYAPRVLGITAWRHETRAASRDTVKMRWRAQAATRAPGAPKRLLARCSLQCKLDRPFGVTRGGVEQRDVSIGGADEQVDLGAAQQDPFGATVDQRRHDLPVGLAR